MIQGQREALWSALNAIAPLELAGGWDNVGVLLDPQRPTRPPAIQREVIFLTIDLTEQVFQEALAAGCTVIVTYHPIIFKGFKRLTPHDPQSRILLEAARLGIGIYSPHTALDAVIGGVCDWLSAAALTASEQELPPLSQVATRLENVLDYRALEPAPEGFDTPSGAGRFIELETPQTLAQVAAQLHARINSGLSVHQEPAYLRHALPIGSDSERFEVRRIALCPGAGGSLFEGVRDVDLLITGEMRHHDVLARAHTGTAVLLTEHTRCERGFLSRYAHLIRSQIDADVICSARDDDPLQLYIPLA